MDVRGRGDEQVRRAGPRLTSARSDMCGDLALAVGDSVIDRKRIEPTLQSAEPEGAHLRGGGHEHTEMQLGQADDADGQLTRQWIDLLSDQNAGIEDPTLGQLSGPTDRQASRRRGPGRLASQDRRGHDEGASS